MNRFDNDNKLAMHFIERFAQENRLNIQQNYEIIDQSTETKYLVNGFYEQDNKKYAICYLNPSKPFKRIPGMKFIKLHERYDILKNNCNKIKDLGYTVIYTYEYDYIRYLREQSINIFTELKDYILIL